MSYKPAACPKCDSIILAPNGEAFIRCPGCQKNISAEDALKILDDHCSIPSNTTEMIEKSLILEKKFGPEIAIPILALLHEKFPENEEILFLIVKMSDFQTQLVREYLTKFKDVPKKVSFAEDFLTNSLTVRNMEFVGMFEDYIKNKLRPHRQERFILLIRELKTSYTKSSNSTGALTLLFVFYVLSSVVNFAAVIFFMLSDLHLLWYAMIAFCVLGLEMMLLFLHNRAFGNRIKIGDRERILMIIYMSSIVILIGGVFIGAVI